MNTAIAVTFLATPFVAIILSIWIGARAFFSDRHPLVGLSLMLLSPLTFFWPFGVIFVSAQVPLEAKLTWWGNVFAPLFWGGLAGGCFSVGGVLLYLCVVSDEKLKNLLASCLTLGWFFWFLWAFVFDHSHSI
ncbi:hypothetical protein SAMN06265373_10736 [Shimia sagamensis]|uniref:Uncharacterized protein n=1 Tax=Shimia sagamensis TaxID=1566352 RepID=A0ABY1PAW2_9RHOB|nr:hypothetical protein SAMN06265373_10736 [Shimia sagamensis]